MNTSLYRSLHALPALLLAAGFAAWAAALDRPLGWAIGADRAFLLWSGWIALALYLVLWAYAARKAAHRTRASFEFARAVPLADLERAQSRLSDLRVDALAGRLTDARAIATRARRILREEGVARVADVEVTPARDGKPARIDLSWRAPLGRLAKWMHAHLYYGLAAAVLVPLHSGMRFTSPMAIALNGLSIAVLATGFVGLLLWTFGPRWLSRAERDLNLERAAALRAHFADKVALVAAELRPQVGGAVDAALSGPAGGGAALLAALPPDQVGRGRDLLTLLGQQAGVHAAHARLARRRLVLNCWRLVHVPLSVLLVLVVAVHVVSVWVY